MRSAFLALVAASGGPETLSAALESVAMFKLIPFVGEEVLKEQNSSSSILI